MEIIDEPVLEALEEEAEASSWYQDVECPYEQPYPASKRQLRPSRMTPELYERFLAAGFRRIGDWLYTMDCDEGCGRCAPLRLRPEAVVVDQGQRRVLRRNQDVESAVAPLQMRDESLELLQRYLDWRHPENSAPIESYYEEFFQTNITNCVEVRYHADSRCIATAVVDLTPQCVNVISFFFDPDEEHRSLEIFYVLDLFELCRRESKRLLYLGYWIESLPTMRYKGAFEPHEILQAGRWRTVGRGDGR